MPEEDGVEENGMEDEEWVEEDDGDEGFEPENGEQMELRVIVISGRNVSMLNYLIIALLSLNLDPSWLRLTKKICYTTRSTSRI